MPAPLVIFSTFVGFVGGGVVGAVVMTIGMFLPAMSFTMVGHHFFEHITTIPVVAQALDGVSAGNGASDISYASEAIDWNDPLYVWAAEFEGQRGGNVLACVLAHAHTTQSAFVPNPRADYNCCVSIAVTGFIAMVAFQLLRSALTDHASAAIFALSLGILYGVKPHPYLTPTLVIVSPQLGKRLPLSYYRYAVPLVRTGHG